MTPKKILWVDDDEDLTLSFRPSLEKEGWVVQLASSVREAKFVMVKDRPNLIVMDIIMEGEHGYSAIEDLKINPELTNVPVIVFSSLTHRWGETTATREDALVSDAVEFVDKSAGLKALIQTIHKYLED